MDVCGALAYRVLIKLSNVADARGERAWRSKADVARELGRSQRSIQRAFVELERQCLVKRGDQSFVRHLRADRRPTVYNLNFQFEWAFDDEQIDGFDADADGETPRGDTVIHTPDGETSQVHTGGHLMSDKELPMNGNNSSTNGDPSTGAGYSSTTCPTGTGGHLYSFEQPDLCSRCGMHRDQLYNPSTFDIVWSMPA
jgi:hypothetical protein